MVSSPHRILILGGARSGKSSYALSIAKKLSGNHDPGSSRYLFIATAQACDDEMKQRIDAHKRQRGNTWHTIEEPVFLGRTLESACNDFPVILIDCLTMWLSNLILTDEADTGEEIDAMILAMKNCASHLILVSNEVGMGIVPEHPLGRRFRDLQGRLNQDIARLCSAVIFMAAGLPMVLKGHDQYGFLTT